MYLICRNIYIVRCWKSSSDFLDFRKINLAASIILFCFIGELRDFYRLAPIAVVGGSFLLGSAGHNLSEAAAAGCAVLTGHVLY